MANLSLIDKQIIEKLFKTEGGYVLDFTNKSFEKFFADELGINILKNKYCSYGGRFHSSKGKRFNNFLEIESNILVGKLMLKLIEYIQSKIMLGDFNIIDYPKEQIIYVKKLSKKLLKTSNINLKPIKNDENINYNGGNITITLNENVFSHVHSLLNSYHYFNAVEESYKIVRQKLKLITGEEQAHKAFSENNFELIFGENPKNATEKDFYEGVKYLHMAIQKLRNEKSHKPAEDITKNSALHYIVLASLAYELI